MLNNSMAWSIIMTTQWITIFGICLHNWFPNWHKCIKNRISQWQNGNNISRNYNTDWFLTKITRMWLKNLKMKIATKNKYKTMLVHRKTNHTINTKHIRWMNVPKIWWKDCGQSRNIWILIKKKRWTFNLIYKNFLTRHLIQKRKAKKKCQNMCLCSQKFIWDSDQKNIIDYGS